MIRLATLPDAAAIAALYTDLTHEMATLAPTVIRPLNAPKTGYFRDYITDDASGVWVATHADTIVGFALAVTATTGVEAEAVPHRFAYLIDIYLTPAARRQGLGHQLLVAVDAWRQANDLAFLQLNVLAANTAARQFYAAQGFTETTLTLMR
ncbi:GNAT family N-acetyltransferase [Lacticaseibacillus absianus]|uniref:GNAT family N-acetyltransferase n=1 Tax=Lacticaseibacillus absianus TaxID=2729623 RepID=UPI0015CB509A|nr:GNAT family N-acetyltransferase [Lacticaseibacillus absianus]